MFRRFRTWLRTAPEEKVFIVLLGFAAIYTAICVIVIERLSK